MTNEIDFLLHLNLWFGWRPFHNHRTRTACQENSREDFKNDILYWIIMKILTGLASGFVHDFVDWPLVWKLEGEKVYRQLLGKCKIINKFHWNVLKFGLLFWQVGQWYFLSAVWFRIWVKSDDFRANVFEHKVHVPSSPYISCSCCCKKKRRKKIIKIHSKSRSSTEKNP